MKPCPTCGAQAGEPCLEASAYTPQIRGEDGQVTGGQRRPVGLYFTRKPHLKRIS